MLRKRRRWLKQRLPPVERARVEAAARLDDSPDERVPFMPDLRCLLLQNTGYDLGWNTEALGHLPREIRVAKDWPFAVAAHQRRLQRVNDAADACLTD